MRKCKIIHQRESCIGCNSCVTIAPQNWTMDDKDGKARALFSKKKGDVYVAEIFKEDYEANCQAADACPMRIIKVEK